jgi:benzoylformate decarboxylase/acetolactate synthase-1/2/3 large subunit
VLIYGSEVGQYVDAIPAAMQLAQTLGAPVLIEDQPAYLAFPTTHANFIGKFKANADVVAAADVILSVGVEYTTIGLGPDPAPWPPGARVISLSVDPVLTVRHAWPDVALNAHPAAALAALDGAVRDRIGAATARPPQAWTASLRERRLSRAAGVRATHHGASDLSPSHLIAVADRHFGDGWIVIDALTSAVKHFDALYTFADPTRYHGLSGKASAQGWGAPTAIGVQLATPEQRVACLVGDGNLMFSATSLVLAGRMRLPMVFVVVNNSGWAHVRGPMRGDAYDDAALYEMGWLFDVDYVAMAAAFGLRGVRVTSAEALDAAIREASQSDEPWLIDAVIRATDP